MKMDMLHEANYVYNFDAKLYFNRSARKAFSFPFLDDHSEMELSHFIHEGSADAEGTANAGWKFYFNFPPSDGARRELETLLSESIFRNAAD